MVLVVAETEQGILSQPSCLLGFKYEPKSFPW